MKKTIISALILLSANVAFANTTKESLQVLTTFLPSFIENAPEIWPGLDVSKHPLITTIDHDDPANQDNGVYAFQFSPSDTRWQKNQLNNVTYYSMPNDQIGLHDYNPYNLSAGFPYFKIENQEAVVFSYDDLDGDDNLNAIFIGVSYFLHYELTESPYKQYGIERFHLTQQAYDGFLSVEDSSFVCLASKVLQDYRTTQDKEILKNYAAIYQVRQQI